MKNNEIYIDGINVEGCRHYRQGSCKIETLTPCPYYKDCYYKQLKRLEKINFELEESLKVFNRPDVNRVLTLYKVGDIDLLEKKCDRLEQENEKLRKINQELAEEHKTIGQDLYAEIKDYRKEKEKLKEENAELKQKYERLITNSRLECLNCEYKYATEYKSALEEIKGNIQDWLNSPWFCFNCRNNMDERLTEILNKIREVIK